MRRLACLAIFSGMVIGCSEPESDDNTIVIDTPDMSEVIEDMAPPPTEDMGPPEDMDVEDMAVDMIVDAEIPDAEPLPACSDSMDNDEDELIDYPLDPGCTHAEDDDEADPELPECDDNEDNDGNGTEDSPDDPGCADPGDPREYSVCDMDHAFVDISGRPRYEGNTEGFPALLNICRSNEAPEAALRANYHTAADGSAWSSRATPRSSSPCTRRTHSSCPSRASTFSP